MVKLDDSKATSEKHLKMRWFYIYTSNTSITSNWGDFFANMFESYLHWHYHLHTPYLPQCPKVGHFWYRCPKCPKWGTKWGAKWGQFVPQKCGTFMFVPHVPQMWYKCGTQMRPHTFFRSQSSILGSQSSLYPKSGVLLSLYPKYPKWGTSGVHKRGLTRFLEDLGIMHFTRFDDLSQPLVTSNDL